MNLEPEVCWGPFRAAGCDSVIDDGALQTAAALSMLHTSKPTKGDTNTGSEVRVEGRPRRQVCFQPESHEWPSDFVERDLRIEESRGERD